MGPDPDIGAPAAWGDCERGNKPSPHPSMIPSPPGPGRWDDRRDRVVGGETRVRFLCTYSQRDGSPGFLKEMLRQDLIAKSLL